MARKSFQRGSVRLKKRRNAEPVWVLRYRVRDPNSKSGWKEKTEMVPECRTKKEALNALTESGAPLDPDNLRHRVLYPALEATGITRQDRMHGFHLFRHIAGSIVHALTRDLKAAQ